MIYGPEEGLTRQPFYEAGMPRESDDSQEDEARREWIIRELQELQDFHEQCRRQGNGE